MCDRESVRVCLEREWGRVERRKKEGEKERDLTKQWGKVIPQQRKLCFQLFTGQFYHWHLNPGEPLSSITFLFPAGNFPSTSLRSRGRTHGGLQTLWHRPPSRCLWPPFPLHFFPYTHAVFPDLLVSLCSLDWKFRESYLFLHCIPRA